ncbi:hypothetical protein O181_014776 [Austropuccinia psidii MF-1]|uniref:Uncharacterized protein n=1 Tax=Austropuccinia psidii MF-1 TaxID=1389203 RepID=A0A9Q3GPF9_9BASI|nr:hypothetical protein [Austropuccinia psidii MF-1]
MSPSPAHRNKEPTPLLREMSENSRKTHTNVESTSESDIDMETDETLDYPKKFMSMMQEIINRLNYLEESKKIEQQRPADENIKQPQNKRDLINRLIAKKEELKRQIEELHRIIAGNFINLLKQGNLLIRTKDEGEKPFKKLKAGTIAEKVEKALEEVQASVNGEKITIKSVIKYQLGDIRFFTTNKAQGSWLLENQHIWTHLEDPCCITSQALYPILLHSVLSYFDITDETSIQEFSNENEIPRETAKRIKWISNPEEKDRERGSVIFHLTNKELAKNLVKGNLAYKQNHICPAVYQEGPPQCYNCLKVGHIGHFFKKNQLVKIVEKLTILDPVENKIQKGYV